VLSAARFPSGGSAQRRLAAGLRRPGRCDKQRPGQHSTPLPAAENGQGAGRWIRGHPDPACSPARCSIIWDDLVMQGHSRMDRELLDAEMLAGHLVPPGSVFAFLAEHRRELFPDSFTADLFPSRTGRPSLPADLVGSVLVLKELHDLSDPQTADALKFDIRWKVACGRSLTQMSFDPSTLVYWRKRIAKSSRPDRGV
jgi:Transposase domain (DUF772)